jgi:hypothetical protein
VDSSAPRPLGESNDIAARGVNQHGYVLNCVLRSARSTPSDLTYVLCHRLEIAALFRFQYAAGLRRPFERASAAHCSVQRADVRGASGYFSYSFGTLPPNERLQIDHVSWAEISKISANSLGKLKIQAVIHSETQSDIRARTPRNVGLQENVLVRQRNESEDSYEGPGGNPRMFARQGTNNFAPALKFLSLAARTTKEIVQPGSEYLGARRTFNRVTQGHLLGREDEGGEGFNADGAKRTFRELAVAHQGSAERLV